MLHVWPIDPCLGSLTLVLTNIYVAQYLSLFLFFYFFIPVEHQIFLADGTSRPILGKGVLHPTNSVSLLKKASQSGRLH
jgi:hypothetical protein